MLTKLNTPAARSTSWPERRLSRLYRRYNRKYWQGKLPDCRIAVCSRDVQHHQSVDSPPPGGAPILSDPARRNLPGLEVENRTAEAKRSLSGPRMEREQCLNDLSPLLRREGDCFVEPDRFSITARVSWLHRLPSG